MEINKHIIDNLCEDAGASRTKKAHEYKEEGRVDIIDFEYQNPLNFEIKGSVYGNEEYHTYIFVKNGEVEDITCDCPDYYNHYGVCKHTLATVLEFVGNENQTKQRTDFQYNSSEFSENVNESESILDHVLPSSYDKYRGFKQIVNIFYNEEIEGIDEEEAELKEQGTIKLEPEIFYDKFTGDMKVEFKVGNKRMYKIKNLSEFYTRMLNKELYRYGQKLQFVHTRESFEKESLPLLDFLMKYAEIIKYANSNSNSNYRFYGNALSETNIILSNSGIDDIFEIMKGKKISFQREYKQTEIEFTEEQPNIQFKLRKLGEDNYEIVPNVEIYKISIIKGKTYKYILDDITNNPKTNFFISPTI